MIEFQSTEEQINAWRKASRRTEVDVVTERRVVYAPSLQRWRQDAFTALQTWLETSTNTAKTIEAWQAVFIRCGRCLVEWKVWVEQNPVTEPVSEWVERATAEILAKRWV